MPREAVPLDIFMYPQELWNNLLVHFKENLLSRVMFAQVKNK